MKIAYALVLLAVFLLIGCSADQPAAADSPSAALKQYVAASQKQDTAAMKALLSKGSIALLDKLAKSQNSTIDELLRKESSFKIQNAPETRNERIEGETATVEIKNETNGEFDMKFPFVREDGAWKLARDKYIGEMMKKASADVNKKLADSALSNNNAANNAAPVANKPAANK